MVICLIMLCFVTGAVFAQLTAEQIIKRMEKNQVHDTSKGSGSMEIVDQFGTRTKTFTSISAGEDNMILEFTNPEEQGQKILRLEDEIYLYFPDAEEVIRLQGGALKDSVMGSDFSYEDLTGEKGILSSYKVELLQPSLVDVDGVKCYHLMLTGIKNVAYPQQELWVDAELFVPRKAHYFSLSGRLLKEMIIKDVKKVAGKNIPVYFEMSDKMKKNSKTIFRLIDIQIDVPLDANTFSLENLSW
jgi:outer membrane lipoprotein-sorting protein